jgi:hypothetical protein
MIGATAPPDSTQVRNISCFTVHFIESGFWQRDCHAELYENPETGSKKDAYERDITSCFLMKFITYAKRIYIYINKQEIRRK